MPLGIEAGLSPGDFMLDGDQPPPKKEDEPETEPPHFWPMFIVAKRLDGGRWYLTWWYASAQATLC